MILNLLANVQDNHQTGTQEPIFEGGYDLTDLLIVIMIIFSIATLITLFCIIYHYYKKTAKNKKKGLTIIIISALLLIALNIFLILQIQSSAKHDKVFFASKIEYIIEI